MDNLLNPENWRKDLSIISNVVKKHLHNPSSKTNLNVSNFMDIEEIKSKESNQSSENSILNINRKQEFKQKFDFNYANKASPSSKKRNYYSFNNIFQKPNQIKASMAFKSTQLEKEELSKYDQVIIDFKVKNSIRILTNKINT